MYLRPLKRYTEHIWYSYQPLGINTLQQVTSKLAACANLPGKRTNHSLHAMGPTHLYECGVDDKLVCELSEHRSNAILEYKCTSGELKHHVSQLLHGNEKSHVPEVKDSKSCMSLQWSLNSQNTLSQNC